MPISNPYRRALLSWIPNFLDAIASGCNVMEACRRAGVTPGPVYKHRKRCEDFRKEWDEAAEIGTLLLEHEAVRRAYHGTDKPVFYKGQECGQVREYSDGLLMFLLRARKPETYGNKYESKQVNLNVDIQSNRQAVDILNKLFNDQGIDLGLLDPLTIAGPPCDGGHGGEVVTGPAPEGNERGTDGSVAHPEWEDGDHGAFPTRQEPPV